MPKSNANTEYDRVRQAVLLGLFSGTGVGLGYLLAAVPGVELMTLNAGLAGLALGAPAAALVGAVSAAVYSLGSPFGPPVPVVLAAQVLGVAAAGWLVGSFATVLRRVPARTASLLAGGLGLLAAGLFDLLTNLAVAVAFALPLLPTLAAGLPLAALHGATAAVSFGALLPALAPRLGRLRRAGPRAVPAVAPAMLLPLGAVLVIAATPVCAAPGAGSGVPAAVADTLAARPRTDTLATPEEPAAAFPDAPGALADTLVAPADSLAAAAAGTLAAQGPAPDPAVAPGAVMLPPFPPGGRQVRGWERPLWEPFFVSLHEDLARRTAWLPVRDGGQGAAAVLLAEPATSPMPRLVRDGLPLQIGHRYLDDPEAIATTGQRFGQVSFGLDARSGAAAGVVELVRDDPAPAHDLTDTRWFKGPHESYLRTLQLLTADAPWRVGFDFYELLDNEGYDFRIAQESRYPEFDQPSGDAFWGHAKFRSGRGTLQRDLGAAGDLTIGLENVRKLKKALPAYGLQHQDLWTTRMDLDWRTRAADRPGRLAFWSLVTDVDWDRDQEGGGGHRRLQEGTYQGVLAAWGEAHRGLRVDLDWGRWTLHDTGADPDWAPAHADTHALAGEEASARLTRSWALGTARAELQLAAWWAEHGGWLAGGAVRLQQDALWPRWALAVERGGRAPRSDELATAWSFVVPAGRRTVALPASDLGREDTWRVAAAGRTRLVGVDLAVSAAIRRLRDGIGWEALPDQATVGRWQNGLELDAATVRLSAGREGRFLGWARLGAAATWRSWQRGDALRTALPPELDWRLTFLWENHLFREDGIVQLGAFLHHRGEMSDPWDLAGELRLPAITQLDLLLGFRLVGTNLGIELANVTGAAARLSAGAVDHGLELRWRLHWVFTH